MSWLSILPSHLSFVETWITRIFLILALLVFGPWAFYLIYDFLLFLWRYSVYEVPVIGGRARGRARPRAPSLTERPNGHKRRFSLARPSSRGNATAVKATGTSVADDPTGQWRKREDQVIEEDD